MKDELGDRIKLYESHYPQRGYSRLPYIARLDGKGFSKFTQGLKRPYDERFSNLMIATASFLLEETNATCAYTQSDEITLSWYSSDSTSQIWYDGRFQKMCSVLAAMASVFFCKNIPQYIPEKTDKLPVFDCRVFQVPNLEEGANAFVWREWDATKNSISMAARHYFAHSELQDKNGSEMQEMLFQKYGVNFNDYPSFFKRGSALLLNPCFEHSFVSFHQVSFQNESRRL